MFVCWTLLLLSCHVDGYQRSCKIVIIIYSKLCSWRYYLRKHLFITQPASPTMKFGNYFVMLTSTWMTFLHERVVFHTPKRIKKGKCWNSLYSKQHWHFLAFRINCSSFQLGIIKAKIAR